MRTHPRGTVIEQKGAMTMDNDTPAPRTRGRRRRFGRVRRLPSGRWQAGYTDRAGFNHNAPATFRTKSDADAWLASIQTDMKRGEWVDPRPGQDTFATWAERWVAANTHLAPRTREGYDSILRYHVLPALGRRPVAALSHHHVQVFVSNMSRDGAAPGTVRNAYHVVKGVLDSVVRSGGLKVNPAKGVTLPRTDRVEKVFLTAAQVEALAEAIANPQARTGTYPEYGLLVRFAAYTGLRAAEIVGLRAGRVDLLRGTVRVVETAVVVNGGRIVERQPTKNRQQRTVVMPRFLVDALAAHLGARAADPEALVFTAPDGGPFRHNAWYRSHFEEAVRQAGLNPAPRFHDLRHTCVALLVANGAHARSIMEQLGHSTIHVTMDTYGHVFPSTLDALAAGLDAAYRAAATAPVEDAEVRQIGGRNGA